MSPRSGYYYYCISMATGGEGEGGRVGFDPSFGNTMPNRLSTFENVEWATRYPPMWSGNV